MKSKGYVMNDENGNISGSNVYGSMFQHDKSTLIDISSSNVWYDITAMDTGLLNNITFQNSKELKITTPGKYISNFNISFSDGGNTVYETAIMVNTTVQLKTANHDTTRNNGDITGVSGGGILTLAVNDIVKLVIMNNSNTNDATIHHAELTLIKIGE